MPHNLQPYTTQKIKFQFYFPQEGQFNHFPTNLAIDQTVVARENMYTLTVVKQRTIAKKETFNDILHSGNRADVLEFMQTHNLIKGEKGFQFQKILWMLKDKDFFKKTTDILRNRHIFETSVWSYSIFHNDE